MASLQGEKVCLSRLNEENRQDYLTAYKAAWLLCRAFFERSPDEALIWNVFPKNIYSRRIAEKLGGQQIDVRDVFTETVRKAYSLSEGGMAKLPNVIVYEIRKVPFEKST